MNSLNSPLFQLPEDATLRELLALPDPWLEDLRQLSWAFFRDCRDLLNREHFLNPTFAGSGPIGGADADLIVERCLIEIKTTVHPSLNAQLLYQMLGYVLLDFDDRFELEEVAVYMSRQSTLVRWTLLDLIETLAEKPVQLATLRQEFEEVVRRAGLQLTSTGLLASGRPVVLRFPPDGRRRRT